MRNLFKAIRYGAYSTVTACLFLFVGSKAVAAANIKIEDQSAKYRPLDADLDKDKKRLA